MAQPEAPIANTAQTPDVTVTQLDRPSKDPVGLLASDLTGLPGVRFDETSARICEDELAWRVTYAQKNGVTYGVEPHSCRQGYG